PVGEILKSLVASVDLASRRWIYEQYDSQVMADTIAGPGGDAGLILVHGSRRGLAVSTDCTPRYVEADPRTGGAQAVAEGWRNLSAIGAKGLAITNNLNFGNPEKPDIMAQMAQSVLGMGDAARALDTPVVSGNVSLYNETDGRAILPCPVVGMVGTIDDIDKAVGMAPSEAGQTLVVIGQDDTTNDGWLGVSLYARNLADNPKAAPPPVDLAAEHRNGIFVQQQIAAGTVRAAHDLSDGGLAVAVAEMCIAGRIGAAITLPSGGNRHGWAFGEDQARYVVATDDADGFLAAARAAGVPAAAIGSTRDDGQLQFGDETAISVEDLAALAEATIPALMQGG
ncbi:MAG: AIR synthase related protein, partial [Pseudomonadota bacterium]|nr:AIR synthase related protein [Pseudomonadota bacterium]